MKVKLGKLEEKGEDLVKFIEERYGVKGELAGDGVDFEDSKMRRSDMKTYLKKFLHANGVRKSYRIFSEKGVFTILPLEKAAEEREES